MIKVMNGCRFKMYCSCLDKKVAESTLIVSAHIGFVVENKYKGYNTFQVWLRLEDGESQFPDELTTEINAALDER